MTAMRWAGILKQQGHDVSISGSYSDRHCDLLIALHALRSAESIRKYRNRYPKAPLVVALTGTDLYRDIKIYSTARQSLELASRLIVLQRKAKDELPLHLHRKTRVIYQSANRLQPKPPRNEKVFKVCVVGHMRPEKDPLRTAMAARLLPRSSRVKVFYIGRALSRGMHSRARREAQRNPRFTWLGELPHWKTRRVLARCHVLSISSKMEGSSNVLSEAIASSIPVIATKIPGLMGTLGENYPGYFPVGNTRALSHLLVKAEQDSKFLNRLKKYCTNLFPLVDPEGEYRSWTKLLKELSKP